MKPRTAAAKGPQVVAWFFRAFVLAVLKNFLLCCSWLPLPQGVPGEGPDCHFLKEVEGLGQIPARIRGETLLLIFISALSTVG